QPKASVNSVFLNELLQVLWLDVRLVSSALDGLYITGRTASAKIRHLDQGWSALLVHIEEPVHPRCAGSLSIKDINLAVGKRRRRSTTGELLHVTLWHLAIRDLHAGN